MIRSHPISDEEFSRAAPAAEQILWKLHRRYRLTKKIRDRCLKETDGTMARLEKWLNETDSTSKVVRLQGRGDRPETDEELIVSLKSAIRMINARCGACAQCPTRN